VLDNTLEIYNKGAKIGVFHGSDPVTAATGQLTIGLGGGTVVLELIRG
jgi:hypothetical protein